MKLSSLFPEMESEHKTLRLSDKCQEWLEDPDLGLIKAPRICIVEKFTLQALTVEWFL